MTTKKAAKTEQPTEQTHHFYASSVVAWAVAETRAKAIRRVLDDSSGMFKPNSDGGIYVYSVRVELPKTAHYEINSYVPQGVPVSDAKQGSFKLYKGTPVFLARVED